MWASVNPQRVQRASIFFPTMDTLKPPNKMKRAEFLSRVGCFRNPFVQRPLSRGRSAVGAVSWLGSEDAACSATEIFSRDPVVTVKRDAAPHHAKLGVRNGTLRAPSWVFTLSDQGVAVVPVSTVPAAVPAKVFGLAPGMPGWITPAAAPFISAIGIVA
jgi:hypothetical protein